MIYVHHLSFQQCHPPVVHWLRSFSALYVWMRSLIQSPLHVDTFCKTCLNKHWDNSQTCSCPYCKETFNQRPDLKINTTLREVADHYKKKSPEKKNEVLCDFCEERKLKALKSCLVCQSSYCETHLEPHFKVAGLKKHKLMDPVSNLEDYICQKHERPLELFCRDDRTCVCPMCALTDHKNHNTVPLEKESEEQKVEDLNKTAFKWFITWGIRFLFDLVKHFVNISFLRKQ